MTTPSLGLMQNGKASRQILFHIFEVFMVLIALLYMFPLYYLVLNTLKPYGEMLKNPLSLPQTLFFDNYSAAFGQMHFFTAFFNSLLITFCSVLVIVILGAMAAYPVARFNNKITKAVMVYFLIGFMIPVQTIVVQVFIIMQKLNLINSHSGLILLYAAGSSFAFFMYQSFIKTVPYELEESAMIDGCSPFKTFWMIVFPLVKPVTVTLVIFESMWIWNDFILAYLFLSSRDKFTLILELYQCVGEFRLDWAIMFSIMVIVLLPMVIFYLFMQKHIMAGLTSGAIKG